MGEKYVIALDQGTTSSRAVLVDRAGRIVDIAQNPFPQLYPQPGWVEHDPRDILSSQLGALTELLVANNLGPRDIDSIGITNQRETCVIWNRETGKPVYNAIVWQCRRTAGIIEALAGDPEAARAIGEKTGLVPDPYFSASKITWILDNVPGARADAEAGKLAFGTVDSWLIWTLTNGRVHATDPTNASRTMLFDIHQMRWDPWLLELFGVPASLLPEVRPSSGDFGVTEHPGVPQGVPIRGVAGDQQAALFGQCCFEAGEAKNTYGTGCFLLMNTGERACRSTNGLVTTLAAVPPGASQAYALEGSVFVAGALIQWLRDELGIDLHGGGERSGGAVRSGHGRRAGGARVHGPGRSLLGCASSWLHRGHHARDHEGARRARRRWNRSRTRWPTWYAPWRRTRARRCASSTWTEALPPTTSSCSSKVTCSGAPCAALPARRAQRSAPRIWRAWRRAFGKGRTICAHSARATSCSRPGWTAGTRAALLDSWHRAVEATRAYR